ncbi:hypothetical protein MKW94_016511 [Papaver nudicaule]|uniref:DUF7722 domain-containing protein n=1 Tax=Papaver nudicaule TaxID=74823 RepID=A0AA41VP20_PAPNU|nr:hypothetical protein [Papaver nudicaule]
METFMLMKWLVNSIEMKFNKVTMKCGGFQMPLHYPRYKKLDYERMEEWKVDMLLREYGLDSFKGLPLMRKGNLLWVLSCGLISSKSKSKLKFLELSHYLSVIAN